MLTIRKQLLFGILSRINCSLNRRSLDVPYLVDYYGETNTIKLVVPIFVHFRKMRKCRESCIRVKYTWDSLSPNINVAANNVFKICGYKYSLLINCHYGRTVKCRFLHIHSAYFHFTSANEMTSVLFFKRNSTFGSPCSIMQLKNLVRRLELLDIM